MSGMNRYIERMRAGIEDWRRFIRRDVWHMGLPGETVPHGIVAKQVRAAILLLRGLGEETILLRASALTFATMLFIVPFLSFMFIFIEKFDLADEVYLKLDMQLQSVVERLGGDTVNDGEGQERHLEATDLVTAFMGLVVPKDLFPETVNGKKAEAPVAMLVEMASRSTSSTGAVAMSLLLFILSTVFGFMRNVEVAFNKIWGVKRSRRVLRSLSDYMMVTLVMPFAAVAVLAVTAVLQNAQLQAALGSFAFGLRGGQFAVLWLVFTTMYFLVPNTRVKLRWAMLGGLVGTFLFALNSWAFVQFQFGLARYAVFYSTFALFPLMVMWIFMSWLILLFGALVTFAYQNEKTFAMERWAEGASYAYREALGLRAVVEMARRFRDGRPGLEVEKSAAAWNVPTRLLHETMECLVGAGLASACATDPVSYLPSRPTDATTVRDVVTALREAGRDPSLLRQEEAYSGVYKGGDGTQTIAAALEAVESHGGVSSEKDGAPL